MTNLARINLLVGAAFVALVIGPPVVDHYPRALDANPGAPEIWIGLALAYVKAGDLPRARSVLERALGRFPDDAESLYGLADVQERLGQTREAVDTLPRLPQTLL